jgi:hypothetical protein
MQYKTIILELLKQRPEMHEQLRQERKLLATLEIYARELKASHESWMEQLAQTKPDIEVSQLYSEAFEMALKELEDRLPSGPLKGDHDELSLDEAMAFIRSPSLRG